MGKFFELFPAAAAAALCAVLSLLIWPMAGPTPARSTVVAAHFAEIHVLDRLQNPVAAAEVFYPGPHCVRPKFICGEEVDRSEIDRSAAVELDRSRIEAIAPKPWKFDDFVRMHYDGSFGSLSKENCDSN